MYTHINCIFILVLCLVRLPDIVIEKAIKRKIVAMKSYGRPAWMINKQVTETLFWQRLLKYCLWGRQDSQIAKKNYSS